MKKTICEKAETAIAEMNAAIGEMRCQMKIRQLDKTKAKRMILRAQKKARSVQNAYFNRYPKDWAEHSRQTQEMSASGLIEDLQAANSKLNEILQIYFAAIPVLTIGSKPGQRKFLTTNL